MARAFHASVTPGQGLHFRLRLIAAAVAPAALSVVALAEPVAGALAGSVSAAAA